MAVTFLLGPPGAGKSYEAVVYQVLPALQQGRKVITNLPLNLEKFSLLDPAYSALIEVRKATSDNLKPFSDVADYQDPWRHPEHGYGPLYVIDECHIPMPRGGTGRDVEEWYSLHRHEGADLVLMTQSYGKVSKSICDLVQTVIVLRKNTALGSQKSYRREVRDGLTRANRIGKPAIRTYKKEYFSLYQSYTRGGKAEAGASDIRPIWKRWEFYSAGVALLIVLYQVVFGSGILPPGLRLGDRPAAPPAASGASGAPGSPGTPPASPKLTALSAMPFKSLVIVGTLELGPEKMPVFQGIKGKSARKTVTAGDLRRMGVNVTTIGPCLVRYEFRGETGEATCE
jgi:zona occludens toxin